MNSQPHDAGGSPAPATPQHAGREPAQVGHLTCQVQGSVATIVLSNPAKRNAMTAQMWRQLPEILSGLAGDSTIRALVVTGDGGHFCAGADIADLNHSLDIDEPGPDACPTRLSVLECAEEALAAFPKPTIAAIRGFCIGGGVGIALACDLRVVAATARFGITPAKIGIIYPPRTTTRLVATVGPAVAKRLLFTAELICAHDAWKAGLVSEPVPDESLGDAVSELLAAITSRSQLSVCGSKAIVNAASEYGIDGPNGAVQQAEFWRRKMAQAADPHEGVTAFLERRAPMFTWHS